MTTKARRRWPRIVAGTMSAVVLTGVGAAGVAGAYWQKLSDQITPQDISQQIGHAMPAPQPGRPVNILLMGSDTRANGNGHGSVSSIAGARSDTTILLHLSGDRTRALAVSIPRDSWVDLPSCKQSDGINSLPRTTRFNEAFYIGGPGCTVKTVEQLTGVTVDHFVVVDFKGFSRVVDVIGGVEVCLKKPVDDPKSQLKLPAGKTVVKGEQALGFVRARYTIGDGSDIGRIERQQAFMGSAIRKATSLGVVANPTTLYGMLSEATKSLTTDPGLASLNAISDLAINSSGIKPSDVTFVTVPIIDNPDGATVSWDPKPSAQLWEAIIDDQPYPPGSGKTSDTGLAPDLITVDVVNSSGTNGVGGNVADYLRSAGFKIGTLTTGENLATSSLITTPIEQTAAGKTVGSRLGIASVTTSGSAKSAAGNVVVTIGTDYTGPGSINDSGAANPAPKTAAEAVCS